MRRTLAAAVAGLALIAGCSGDAKVAAKAEPIETVRQAGPKTAAARTAKMSLAVATVTGGETVNVTGEGAFALDEQRGSIKVTLGQLGTADAIVLGDALYLKVPALTLLTGGKPWIRLELADLLKASGSNAELLRQLANQRPAESLAYLSSVSGEVTVVGQETVRGTVTTHYKASIDLDLVATGRPASKPALDLVKKQLGGSLLPVEVWIDDSGLVRRMKQQLSLTVDGTKSETTVTVELYDFGTPVEVSAPPAAETSDGAPLLGVS